jgi:hypothetical protein
MGNKPSHRYIISAPPIFEKYQHKPFQHWIDEYTAWAETFPAEVIAEVKFAVNDGYKAGVQIVDNMRDTLVIGGWPQIQETSRLAGNYVGDIDRARKKAWDECSNAPGSGSTAAAAAAVRELASLVGSITRVKFLEFTRPDPPKPNPAAPGVPIPTPVKPTQSASDQATEWFKIAYSKNKGEGLTKWLEDVGRDASIKVGANTPGKGNTKTDPFQLQYWSRVFELSKSYTEEAKKDEDIVKEKIKLQDEIDAEARQKQRDSQASEIEKKQADIDWEKKKAAMSESFSNPWVIGGIVVGVLVVGGVGLGLFKRFG